MGEQSRSLRWGIEQRLEFIEFRLFWEGGVNRADIIDYFGVSVPQASKDLTHYQEVAPGNMHYDKSLKRYFATDTFNPKFLEPDAAHYLSQVAAADLAPYATAQTRVSQPVGFATVPQPQRAVDPHMLRQLLTVMRSKRAVEIRYQSLNPDKPKPQWRWITPHAFCFDGMRWHARAYCHERRLFRDFLLPRISGVRGDGEPGAHASRDHAWHEIYNIKLKPHPGLSEDQQKAVAADYGMKDGEFEIPMRLAMLFYFRKQHLGLDYKEHEKDPQQQHIVMADPDSVRSAQTRADALPAE
ncbi:WYL domain-containing protein [Mesorhizobium microcysteis]|uniref:WYL domain-containing protein n=1 Tax=Neoaquamicrobium microcysteis TaxID=2682781 RepID=A0A5D4H5U6_9HYPH|nr:WYL domain-containing protein [Mesorhizobium microcysteis]TYR36068.1 WYL domain-containing protein [Mesorhizobium microcysteis]